jgi:Phage tail tube protein
MALGSGLAAQIGVAAETTYGTGVTVTRFYPVVDESITLENERLVSAGIIAGARVLRSEQWTPGADAVGGDVGLELYQQHTALLFEHMFGSITSSITGGVATHTVTPGDLTGKSLTVQVGRPQVGGVVVPFTYAGVKVAEWELSCQTGEIVTLGLTVVAQSETTGTALAAATYGTGAGRPYTFINGALTVSGSSACVRGITISGNNQLTTERMCVGSQVISEPLENALREYTGTLSVEWSSTAQYQAFRNGLEVSVVLSLSAASTAQATITMNARYDGVTPNVGGPDIIVTEVPFVCVATSTDATAIQAVLKNSQTSP